MTLIAELGRHAAARKSRDATATVRKAIAEMTREIELNGGVYPENSGVVSSAEVLRRAGLSAAALQKPARRPLRTEVMEWVESVRARIARGSAVVRRAVTERADRARLELNEFQQAWVEVEHEYTSTKSDYEALLQRFADLEAENARLRSELKQAAMTRSA